MLKLETNKLLSLFQDFYALTSIRICLFDDTFCEILRYPSTPCNFCNLVRQNKDMDDKCRQSDNYAFKKCRETFNRYTYRCHMNLIETATPIFYEKNIIGYIMIGQIADSLSDFNTVLPIISQFIQDTKQAEDFYKSIKSVSDDKIRAAAHILDACAGYLYVSKLISAQNESIAQRIDAFITKNISKNITVDTLCREFHTSRVELYNIFSVMCGTSVANYIKTRKLLYAADLLASTDFSITKIAEKCGISDYNYFSKIFKKHFGISATNYKKNTVAK